MSDSRRLCVMPPKKDPRREAAKRQWDARKAEAARIAAAEALGEAAPALGGDDMDYSPDFSVGSCSAAGGSDSEGIPGVYGCEPLIRWPLGDNFSPPALRLAHAHAVRGGTTLR